LQNKTDEANDAKIRFDKSWKEADTRKTGRLASGRQAAKSGYSYKLKTVCELYVIQVYRLK